MSRGDGVGGRPVVTSLRTDFRTVVRSLRRRPGYTIASVVTIALAIGANAAVFSVVDAVLIRSLPFPHPDRLVMVWETIRAQGEDEAFLSFADFRDYRGGAESFEDMAAFFARPNQDVNLTGGAEPERVNVARVTHTYFDVLGVTPVLGRAFTEDEDREGNHRVAIFSHALWARQFGSNPDIVGQSVRVNGFPYVVLGVMPEDFRPVGSMALGEEVEMWRPLAASVEQQTNRAWRDLRVVGRLAPGASVTTATRDLEAIAGRIASVEPDTRRGRGVRVVGLHEQSVGGVRSRLGLLWGAVGFVLLIACANVANLQLIQAAGRGREISIRASLGAGRARIARLLFVESGVLAASGAGLGLVLAWLGVDAIRLMAGDQTPLLDRAGIDFRVVIFTLLVAGATVVLFGTTPAMRASRVDLTSALKDGASGGGNQSWGGSRVFVVMQLVLTMVLLVGSGLLLKSFSNLRGVDPGFEPGGLVTFQVELPMVTKYPTQEGREQFFAELRQRLGSLPGVLSASNASSVPMGEGGFSSSFWIDGRPEPDAAERPVADLRLVGPGYFATMKIPLLRGRASDGREIDGGAREVVVNRTLVERFFPETDPEGVILRPGNMPPGTIIGVVGDVRLAGLADEPRPTIYYAADQVGYNFMTMVVRTGGRPENAVTGIRNEVASMDAELPLHNVRTVEDLLDANVRSDHFTSRLLSLFAALALGLAGVGTYGVMASTVARRRRELGIRAAMGARPTDAFWAVVRDGSVLVLAGIAIGGVLAASMSDALEGKLYTVDPLDPLTYVLTAGFLALVGLGTVAGIALRAATADPAETLRTE